jgi:large subunit ribosomal protein L10
MRAMSARMQQVEYGMDRLEKAELVTSLNADLAAFGVVVVTRNLGMTVAQSTDLRTKMRDAGASYKVTKNKLAKLAIEGTPYASLDFAKTNDKFEIVGGAMGDLLLDVNGIKSLASLPSLDELRAKIVGLVQAPATKVVQIVQAPAGQLARVLGAYAAKEAA